MRDVLLALEKAFFDKTLCHDTDRLQQLFSDNIIEFGESGAIYHKQAMVAALADLTADKDIEILEFTVCAVGEDAYLVRYIARDRRRDRFSLRSSIWIGGGGGFKLLFHQGTPTTREKIQSCGITGEYDDQH